MHRITRRRILLAPAFCVICAAAWWFWPRPLNLDERRFVGTWQYRGTPTPGTFIDTIVEWRLAPDRSCRIRALDAKSGDVIPRQELIGYWWAEGGVLSCDWHNGRFDQLVRRVKDRLRGVSRSRLDTNVIESVTDGEMVFRLKDGTLYRLTRVADE